MSKPQRWWLVLWSAAIALTGTAGIVQINALLALVLEQREQTVFQRLREWYLERDQKSGSQRRDLDVTTCFGPLLCWVIRRWAGSEKKLALVLDATTLGEQWTVLALCVVIGRCSIPVAWKVIGAHEKGSWRPHWKALLKEVQGTVPSDWFVLVLADRGLYAHWLFDAIANKGWHPFLRINTTVKARLCGTSDFDWISVVNKRKGCHLVPFSFTLSLNPYISLSLLFTKDTKWSPFLLSTTIFAQRSPTLAYTTAGHCFSST